MERKFTMLDENFTCNVCGKDVTQLKYTARDHCPFCLHSMHLDENPGDRASTCKGVLEPIAIKKAKKDKFKIIYKCIKCGQIKNNIAATDDNMDLIIELSSKPFIEE